MYALVAKDQLMSFRDHSLAACARRESIEVEASSRSQREATESKAAGGPTSPIGGAGSDGGAVAVSVAPCLADARMDQYWSMVRFCPQLREAKGLELVARKCALGNGYLNAVTNGMRDIALTICVGSFGEAAIGWRIVPLRDYVSYKLTLRSLRQQ